MEGSIHVSAKLVLKATAVIKGDIFAQTLEIEPNARFNGVCKMSGKNNDKILFHNKVTEPEERFLLQFCDFLFYI